MKTYGQYCPIARTSELFAERWTPIIIRNLLAGCVTFSQLREGAPGIPKALLVERLALLERRGVLRRDANPRGRGWLYALTEKGLALKPVCDAMGEWGARWLELEPHHFDPAYALWATCRLTDLEALPEHGVVVKAELEGVSHCYWMMLLPPRAEMCTSSMGRTEDLVLRTDAETLICINLRQLTVAQAVKAGRLSLSGPRTLVRQFPTWFRPSPFAHTTTR